MKSVHGRSSSKTESRQWLSKEEKESLVMEMEEMMDKNEGDGLAEKVTDALTLKLVEIPRMGKEADVWRRFMEEYLFKAFGQKDRWRRSVWLKCWKVLVAMKYQNFEPGKAFLDIVIEEFGLFELYSRVVHVMENSLIEGDHMEADKATFEDLLGCALITDTILRFWRDRLDARVYFEECIFTGSGYLERREIQKLFGLVSKIIGWNYDESDAVLTKAYLRMVLQAIVLGRRLLELVPPNMYTIQANINMYESLSKTLDRALWRKGLLDRPDHWGFCADFLEAGISLVFVKQCDPNAIIENHAYFAQNGVVLSKFLEVFKANKLIRSKNATSQTSKMYLGKIQDSVTMSMRLWRIGYAYLGTSMKPNIHQNLFLAAFHSLIQNRKATTEQKVTQLQHYRLTFEMVNLLHIKGDLTLAEVDKLLEETLIPTLTNILTTEKIKANQQDELVAAVFQVWAHMVAVFHVERGPTSCNLEFYVRRTMTLFRAILDRITYFHTKEQRKYLANLLFFGSATNKNRREFLTRTNLIPHEQIARDHGFLVIQRDEGEAEMQAWSGFCLEWVLALLTTGNRKNANETFAPNTLILTWLEQMSDDDAAKKYENKSRNLNAFDFLDICYHLGCAFGLFDGLMRHRDIKRDLAADLDQVSQWFLSKKLSMRQAVMGSLLGQAARDEKLIPQLKDALPLSKTKKLASFSPATIINVLAIINLKVVGEGSRDVSNLLQILAQDNPDDFCQVAMDRGFKFLKSRSCRLGLMELDHEHRSMLLHHYGAAQGNQDRELMSELVSEVFKKKNGETDDDALLLDVPFDFLLDSGHVSRDEVSAFVQTHLAKGYATAKAFIESGLSDTALKRVLKIMLPSEPRPFDPEEEDDPIIVRYDCKGMGNGGGLISIRQETLDKLTRETFLNDEVIEFQMNYVLYHGVIPESRQEMVVLFPSVFFKGLRETFEEALENLKGKTASPSWKATRTAMEKHGHWLRKHHAQMFKRRYWAFPVNWESHWSLIIACGMDRMKSKPDAKITLVHLDSLNQYHESDQRFVKLVGQYIFHVFNKCHDEERDPDGKIDAIQVKPPQQTNEFDCGVYVCQYFEEFLGDETFFAQQMDDFQAQFQSRIGTNWFDAMEVERCKRLEIHQNASQFMITRQQENYDKAFQQTIDLFYPKVEYPFGDDLKATLWNRLYDLEKSGEMKDCASFTNFVLATYVFHVYLHCDQGSSFPKLVDIFQRVMETRSHRDGAWILKNFIEPILCGIDSDVKNDAAKKSLCKKILDVLFAQASKKSLLSMKLEGFNLDNFRAFMQNEFTSHPFVIIYMSKKRFNKESLEERNRKKRKILKQYMNRFTESSNPKQAIEEIIQELKQTFRDQTSQMTTPRLF